MKNRYLLFATLLLAIIGFSSCGTSRGYGSSRKGYGCPNSAGIKIEQKATGTHA